MPSVLSTPPFSGRRPPFPLAGAASFRTAPALAAARRLLEPSHLNGGAWPMERCRDALKRPPATPSLAAAYLFLLPSPSHPSARPPALAAVRRLLEPSHLDGARGPWFAAATTPNARRRPTFGRRLPFPLAGAASFRTAPALAAARLFPEPSHLNGARGPWFAAATTPNARRHPCLWPPSALSACRTTPIRTAPSLAVAALCPEPTCLNGERGPWNAAKTPANARRHPCLWPPPTFSSCRSRVLPHGPCSCRRPPFPGAVTP